MLEQQDPTDMNRQFTYGSQLSSSSLAVDSHKQQLLCTGLEWVLLCVAGGGDNKKSIFLVATTASPK
eukprot:13320893-Ditylum_brightwellii.AAC.1